MANQVKLPEGFPKSFVIFGIDPGATTGVARVRFSQQSNGEYTVSTKTRDIAWPEDARTLRNWLSAAGWLSYVAYEDYIIYTHEPTANLGQRPPSLRVIGALELLHEVNKFASFVGFRSSQTKLIEPEEMLAAFGPLPLSQAQRHQFDALRVAWLQLLVLVTDAKARGEK